MATTSWWIASSSIGSSYKVIPLPVRSARLSRFGISSVIGMVSSRVAKGLKEYTRYCATASTRAWLCSVIGRVSNALRNSLGVHCCICPNLICYLIFFMAMLLPPLIRFWRQVFCIQVPVTAPRTK